MASSIITSVITGGSNNHSTVSSEANSYATDWVSQGVLGSITNTNGVAPTTGSFGVNQNTGSDMNIKILGSGNTGSGAAVAYVTGTPSTQDKQVVRARMTADYTAYAINSNSSGSTVYDFIYLSFSAANANVPSAAADNVVTLVTQRSTTFATDSNGAPTYSIPLAVVTVANGASSITNANITDLRTSASISVTATSNTNGWSALTNPLTYASNAGNKEFTATASVDLTGTLSPGMRLKVSRSVTPPSQSMAFASASSQYATKASPSGVTFTSAFTTEAWIYLNSYTSGIVVGRTDSTNANGWQMYVDSNGCVNVGYIASSNSTAWLTYQSLPLSRWVHIAAVVSSVSSKTLQGIYINGTSVPTKSGSSATTTLTQAGNLSLGANAIGGAPSNFFNGYMSEVRVWSVAQTSGNIQANMTKNLIGSESNLVALFQGNGNFTDSTSNANTLTANGGAIATQAANPYNATEYGIITNVSYSNPTTTVTIFTGTDYTLPNMTLNNPFYSVDRSPYGFPAARTKWLQDSLYLSSLDLGAVSSGVNTWTHGQLSIPTGSWRTSYQGGLEQASTTASVDAVFDLNTAASGSPTTSLTNILAIRIFFSMTGVTANTSLIPYRLEAPLLLTSQTVYNLHCKPNLTTTAMGIRGDFTPFSIVAESAYA